MHMKKTSLLLIITFLLGACNKFLDVKPEDRLLEDQVYSTETGINTAINGAYVRMGGDGLYGGNLTMSAAEVMGQQYNLSNISHIWGDLGRYNYGSDNVKSTFTTIWSEAYKGILQLNAFIPKLAGTQNVLSAANKKLLIGEAYGLRAMLHFDLLRIFGPVYSTDPNALSIPYYTAAVATANDLLPAHAVLDKVLLDLDSATLYLHDDPLTTGGLQESSVLDGSNFYRYRRIHMNYFAVEALRARVMLYAGRKAEALSLAESVITAAGNYFPWTPRSATTDGNDPDKVFSSEVIFGVQNLDLYSQFNLFFASTLLANSILAPLDQRLMNAYENNENDYRFGPWWKLPTSGGKDYRTFFKYDDPGPNSTGIKRYLQPLIRITEMYYIAAETQTDPVKALQYLNTVRLNRGLADLPAGANLQNALQLEYQREFYGEGQLFFYYKRNAAATIPNGSSVSGSLSMTALQYVVPLPLSETQYRQ